MIAKRVIAVLTAFVILTVSCLPANAVETAHHWYCVRTKDGTPPPLPSELTFIRNHNAFYLDENARQDDKVIFLTFDAGYENGNVARILDTLEAHDAQGAFFVLEHLITANTELIQRMLDGGHLVCNHTARHKDMAKVSDFEAFQEELKNLETVFKDTTGEELAPFYRPPQGSFTEQNLCMAKEMGYATVFWSFAYADWDNEKQPDPAKSIDLILKHTHNGMILLLHPTSQTNAEIMDTLLTKWEEMGYRFGSLEELTQ